MGGFKIINGPPKNGKGPMPNEEDLKSSNKASLPKPTQAGRIKPCTELISKAMRCLENNDKDCVIKMLEELVRNQCHNGYAVGKEIADKVKDLVHDLWLVSDNEFRCGLLRMLRDLRDLGISKNWVREALRLNSKDLNKRLVKCSVDWESKAMRNDIVKVIESLLRERFGWDEIRMCEELWRFIGVNIDEFRKHGIEPCVWFNGLEKLSDLRRPYWFGLRASDLTVREFDDKISLEIDTSSSVGAVFFPALLGTIKTPSLFVKRGRGAPAAKYVHGSIELKYYVDLGIDGWPWPIKLNANELERILNSLSDEELAEFIAGEIDGDGSVRYNENNRAVYVEISACKNCPKRVILNILKEVIAERLGVTGSIRSKESTDALVFGGKKAVRLLRCIVKYMHHPLRRLRAEIILAYYSGKISKDEFTKLYEQTEYEQGAPDVKRNHALEALARAAPQTHTHGDRR
jgi:hypothetical protein